MANTSQIRTSLPCIPQIFERKQLRRNRDRCAKSFKDHNFLFKWVEQELLDRLGDIKHNFHNVLQIGARTSNNFTSNIIETAHIQSLSTMDITEKLLKNHKEPTILGDEESLPFAQNTIDMVLSALSIHVVNDLPGCLMRINRVLKADGLFLAAMFGGETLHELRQSLTHAELEIKGGASPRIAPFADKKQMGDLLQRAGFALPVVDSDMISVTYDTMFDLLHDLRGMGESNIITARDKSYTGRNFFTEAERYYAKHFSEPDGRIHASFEIIFLIGWSPHSSQQQPLKPGSATYKLEEILK